MDWTPDFARFDMGVLAIVINGWMMVGWLGNVLFFSRFFVQWHATEKRKQVVVPVAFWWLSLGGAFLLFSYALFYRRDPVFIFAYGLTWIPYLRNLMIHRRHVRAHRTCSDCGQLCPPHWSCCSSCGTRLVLARPG